MRLLRYVLQVDTARQVLLILLVVTAVLLGFLGMALEGRMIDDAIRRGATDLLFRYAAAYLAVGLLGLWLDFRVELLYAATTQRILTKLRTDLFEHVLRLGPGFFHRNPVGEVMSRLIPEVQGLGTFLSRATVVPVSCTVTLLTGFGLVSSLDWRLGLVSAGIFSTVLLFLPRLRKRLDALSRQSPRLLRAVSRRTEETLSHIQEIHVHGTYRYEEARFADGLRDLSATQVSVARVFGATSFLTRSLSLLATLSVYTLGGWLVVRESGLADGLTVGDIFVVVRVMGTVMGPLGTLIDWSQKLREAEARFDLVTDYLRVPQDMVDAPDAVPPARRGGGLTLDRVAFGFEPGRPIVEGLNVDIRPGEWVALVGPAGCGKSTVNLLLTRLVKPTEGQVRLDGEDLSRLHLQALRADVGYLSQAKTSAPVLFGGTLLDNLLYGLQRGEGPDCLDLAGAGYAGTDELYGDLVQLLREVGLYDDVLAFGFTGVTLREALERPCLFPLDDAEDIRAELLRGRRRFLELMAGREGLVEFFRADRFAETASVLENLIFAAPAPLLADPSRYRDLVAALGEAGLEEAVTEVGRRTGEVARELLAGARWTPSSVAARLGVSSAALPEDLDDLLDRVAAGRANEADRAALLRLGLEHDPSRSPDVFVDEALRSRIVAARARLAQGGDRYDPERYVDGATVRDNLLMGRVNPVLHRAEEKVHALLREVVAEIDLEDEMIRLGLRMDVGERGARLSGGQAQKAALVRVLLKRPRLLILDEATSALDNASQRQVQRLLRERYRGRTVVEVAHRLETIQDFDRIVALKSGKVVEQGSFAELMERKGLFHELWTGRSEC